jgi:hypothetical protein
VAVVGLDAAHFRARQMELPAIPRWPATKMRLAGG